MGNYRVKNTARATEVYHDGADKPVRLSFKPGEERTVELSDAGAKEITARAEKIGEGYRGLVIMDGKVRTAGVATTTEAEEIASSEKARLKAANVAKKKQTT